MWVTWKPHFTCAVFLLEYRLLLEFSVLVPLFKVISGYSGRVISHPPRLAPELAMKQSMYWH